MPITITPHPDGAVLAVRVQPGARKNAALGGRGGSLKVAVTAPPEGGRANAAVLELLRDWLGVRRSEVELVAGHTSRNKQFLVRGRTADDLAALVAAKLGR
ncbi:MAG: DUF167 domain-containing protein [Gemmataceae bacterium]|nr:DUF167 domain-containing protein [Gemmataceae bacterium]